jgi:hypothetical protein
MQTYGLQWKFDLHFLNMVVDRSLLRLDIFIGTYFALSIMRKTWVIAHYAYKCLSCVSLFASLMFFKIGILIIFNKSTSHNRKNKYLFSFLNFNLLTYPTKKMKANSFGWYIYERKWNSNGGGEWGWKVWEVSSIAKFTILKWWFNVMNF